MSKEYPDFVIAIDGIYHNCHPVCRQEYKDCYFEAGFIDEHPIDPAYLLLHRDAEETLIYLRMDEIAAIAWVINGLLWTDAMNGGASALLWKIAELQSRLEEK